MARGRILGYLQSLDPILLQPQYPVYSDGAAIGRNAEQCQVILSRDYVSRRHCMLEVEGDGVALVDNESTNGLFVNAERIKRRALQEGDIVSLGKAEAKHFLFSHKSAARQREISLPLQPLYRIGRSPNVDVPLMSDPTVSGLHAVLRVIGQRLVLEDMGSAAGTFVNGTPIRKAEITRSDHIRIGSTDLGFDSTAQGLRVLSRETRNQLQLEAKNLVRTVKGRVLLRDVNLVVKPGEFVGMLGPSGAGKSTLLTALCGFQPANSGEVLINGASLYRGFDMYRNSIGYVPQDDIIHRELTVEKSLVYTAQLRLPRDFGAAQIGQNVNSVIETLGLEHVRNNEVARLSGGQRKRVSVGCELLTKPSIIFLDEPTSGLDPSTEEKLMHHFGQMANQGQTVIVTTHILYNLDLLDLVIILARGRLVYFGPVADLCPFFDGPDRPVSRPLDVFDALEPDTRGDSTLLEKTAEAYEQKYLNSPLFQEYVIDRGGQAPTESGAVIDSQTSSESVTAGTAPAPAAARPARRLGRFIAGFLDMRQFLILLRRMFDLKLSAYGRLIVPLVTPLVLAFLTGAIKLEDTGKKTLERNEFSTNNQPQIQMMEQLKPPVNLLAMKYEGIGNFPVPLSVPFIMIMTGVFLGTLAACLEISGERSVYLRERAINLKLHLYLLSKLPFLFLLGLVQVFIYVLTASILLKMHGAQIDGDQIINIIAIVTAVVWVSSIIGLFISTLDPTPGQNSVILAVVAVLPQLVLAGAQGPGFYNAMGPVMKALAAALPALWGFEMILNVLYKDPPWAQYVAHSKNWISGPDPGYMGFSHDVFLTNSAALAIIGGVFFLASCVSLKRYDRL